MSADLRATLLALLPTGPVWPRQDGSTLARSCAGVAAIAGRLQARAVGLLVDAFPATALELLPEWEATLGLPDRCAGAATTLQQRRAQVTARLTAQGGQSVPYLVAQAAALGYAVTVEEFVPARAGLLRAGQPLSGEAWAHTLRIRAPAVTVTRFRAGRSAAGEPLAAWGNAALECALRRLRPAHTVLLFAYGAS